MKLDIGNLTKEQTADLAFDCLIELTLDDIKLLLLRCLDDGDIGELIESMETDNA